GVLAEQADAHGRLSGLLEMRRQPRHADFRRKGPLEPRQETRPGEPPLSDDLQEAAAFLGQGRDPVAVQGGARLGGLPRGAVAAAPEAIPPAGSRRAPRRAGKRPTAPSPSASPRNRRAKGATPGRAPLRRPPTGAVGRKWESRRARR